MPWAAGSSAFFGRPFAAFNRVLPAASATAIRAASAARSRARRGCSRSTRVLIVVAVIALPRRAGRLHPDAGQAVPVRDRCSSRRPRPSTAPTRSCGGWARSPSTVPGVKNVVQFPGLNAIHFVATPNVGVMFVGLEPSERARTRGRRDRDAHQHGLRPDPGGARLRRCCRRPCSDSAMPTASSSTSRTAAAIGYGELYKQHDGLIGALGATTGFDPMATFTSYQSNVPAARRRRRPHQGQGAGPRADRRLQHAAGLPRLGLRQRLQPVRPHLSVYAQADAPLSATVQDIQGLKVRNSRGEMVPLGSVVDIKPSYGPDPVIRYNGYAAADMSAGLNPAVLSSTDALGKVRAIAEQVLPRGMAIEWTGLTYQQVTQGNTALLVFPLCVLLVYLVLCRAVRELVAAARDHPDRAAVPAVGDRRHLAHQFHPRPVARDLAARVRADLPRQQHLHQDRPRRADRPRLQERDPDRRVRARPRGTGQAASSTPRSRPAACACGRS